MGILSDYYHQLYYDEYEPEFNCYDCMDLGYLGENELCSCQMCRTLEDLDEIAIDSTI